MRKTGLIVILSGLLIGGCGSTTQTAQLPTIPTSSPIVITPSPTLSPSSAALFDSPALESRTASSRPSLASDTQSASAATEVAPPPTDSTQTQPGSALGEPTRIVIQAIGMDRKLVSVGLDGSRVPIVPEHDVGWYNLSAMPGHNDNIVLWGHVLPFINAPNIPAPFAQLKDLAVGTKITLYDGAGEARTYAVTQQVWARPDQIEYILPKGKEMMTLVSCIGDKVVSQVGVEMTHRLITIAEPV